MSLPSGLIFYLDYTYGTAVGADRAGTTLSATYMSGTSIYNAPVGKGVRSGSLGIGGQYNLAGSGYSKVHVSTANMNFSNLVASGAYGGTSTFVSQVAGEFLHATGSDGKLIQFDPQLTNLIEDPSGASSNGVNSISTYIAVMVQLSCLTGSGNATQQFDLTQAKEIGAFQVTGQSTAGTGLKWVASTSEDGPGSTRAVGPPVQTSKRLVNVRRLNQVGRWNGSTFSPEPLIARSDTEGVLLMICSGSGDELPATTQDWENIQISGIISPELSVGTDGDTLTIPSFESNFGTTPSPVIPEIDIKIESVAVTAVTRKLRARWSPELAQDLNAYHSLDAEVELTQILSEQIALEIDREILNDLLTQAKTSRYWSRAPGKFVNRETGTEITRSDTLAPGPAFTGTVREWYETLTETIIDVANEIHRLTLRGSANFIVVSPDVATMLEASVLYRPNYTIDGDGQVGSPFSIGCDKVGTLSNRFTVYKDPYFPRNKVLVGYKGGSYLETGYVYAPYVPLIVTPTIFAPEDFTPRKGVMTRYGKKMVRSDFYGTVTVLDLNVI